MNTIVLHHVLQALDARVDRDDDGSFTAFARCVERGYFGTDGDTCSAFSAIGRHDAMGAYIAYGAQLPPVVGMVVNGRVCASIAYAHILQWLRNCGGSLLPLHVYSENDQPRPPATICCNRASLHVIQWVLANRIMVFPYLLSSSSVYNNDPDVLRCILKHILSTNAALETAIRYSNMEAVHMLLCSNMVQMPSTSQLRDALIVTDNVGMFKYIYRVSRPCDARELLWSVKVKCHEYGYFGEVHKWACYKLRLGKAGIDVQISGNINKR